MATKFVFNPLSNTFDLINDSAVDPNYYQIFNATTDWGAPSGGYYTITVLESAHGKGLHPLAEIFELNGSVYERVEVDLLTVDSITGNISFRVPETPDLRFVGKIVIA
jgi:hypothetical protein